MTSMKQVWGPIFLLISAVIWAGCDFPRDQVGTLEKIKAEGLRVGIVNNPPWVEIQNGEPRGIEADFARAIADQLGVRVEWVHGDLRRHTEALSQFQLDLLIGGFTDDIKLVPTVGRTSPYVTAQTYIAANAPGGLPASLAGATIDVRRGSPFVEKLKEHGLTLRIVDDLSDGGNIVLREDEISPENDRVSPEYVLKNHKHILLVPPGENKWLLEVEKALGPRSGQHAAAAWLRAKL